MRNMILMFHIHRSSMHLNLNKQQKNATVQSGLLLDNRHTELLKQTRHMLQALYKKVKLWQQ